MIGRCLFGLCFLLASKVALAQCPYGIPNNPGCVPPDAWPQNQGGQPAQRQPYWVYTWGALSRAGAGSPLGVSTGYDSKRLAEKAAIKDCREKGGGKGCKAILSYHHQCVAVATGKAVAWGHGPDLKETEKRVLDDCNNTEGERECSIYYSNCTKPYLVE